MAARHSDKRLRAPGAGRPRKTPRRSDRPVAEEVVAEVDPRHRLVTTKYNPARTWTASGELR